MKHRSWILALALLGTALSAAPAPEGLELRAQLKPDRVSVWIGTNLFTEYLFLDTEKYPYFYPVAGPRSGRSVTIRRGAEFPHHSSLFFGCDMVNGGNYWQEGLERGRIVSKGARLVQAQGRRIVIEQECQWERPGAAAPFTDRRVITISAPSEAVRLIDFEITLTAQAVVRIRKTNHSLFAARVAPELSVKGGGRLVNAQGARSEAGTFGKPSAWADFRGAREGGVEGIALFAHPSNRWAPSPWFTRDYGFMSPTPLNWMEQGVELAQGETLALRYRAVIHAGDPQASVVEGWYQEWAGAGR